MKTDYRIGRAAARFILKWVLGVQWVHADRVPPVGPILVTPNHRSYLDPPLVGCGLHRELHFFAKAELFEVPVLKQAIRVFNSIPVHRERPDRRSLARAVRSVREGGGLVLFPEGTRAAPGAFLPPKLGVGMIACQADAPIVPVYIQGSGGGWRSLLRSALRIERIRVIYGEPVRIESTAEPRSRKYEAIAESVMDHVRGLVPEEPS